MRGNVLWKLKLFLITVRRFFVLSYSCVYEDTIFYDPKNKHSIIRVRTKDNSIPNKARKATNSRDDFIRFVAKGYNLPQTNKISMILDGEWENSKYGTQLNVESCEEIVPYTDEGMKGYLSSCLIKGIGAVKVCYHHLQELHQSNIHKSRTASISLHLPNDTNSFATEIGKKKNPVCFWQGAL